MSSRCLAPAATIPMIALLASTVLFEPGVVMAQVAAPLTDATTATGQTPTAAPEVPIAQPAVPAAPIASPSAAPAEAPAATSQSEPVDTAPPAPGVAPQAAPSNASGDGSTSLLPEVFEVPREDLPHDLSPIGMFLAADWVVKFVMISLAFASLVTWTVWFGKTLQLAGARSRAARALRLIGDARTLEAAIQSMQRRRGVVAAMLNAAQEEMRFSDAAIDHAGGGGVKERVGSALSRIEVRAGRNMSKGTGVLATIGSTAPFVGLFGTVWGIMNSFIGISESNTTNLAVVAPGIAEALLATAIGLVAAIPAVIIYNVFARSITSYRQLLGDASAQVERLVSRDLDFRKVPASAATASKIKLVTE